MKVTILGNGAWGQAILSLMESNNISATVLGKGETSEDNDIVILSVPTQELRNALNQVTFRDKIVIVNTAKGIETKTHKFPHEITTDVLGKEIEYYSLIGPSFANEVIEKMPTLVNLGYADPSDSLLKIKEILQTDYFRIKPSQGIEVLELSAAFKNIYAVGCGVADGLGYGSNTRVKLIVLAIEEIQKLSTAFNIQMDASETAGTIGDLVLTCNSAESRNFAFGRNLSKMSVDQSLNEVKATVEGYYSIDSLDYIEKKSGISMPLVRFISDIIKNDNYDTIRSSFQKFVSNI